LLVKKDFKGVDVRTSSYAAYTSLCNPRGENAPPFPLRQWGACSVQTRRRCAAEAHPQRGVWPTSVRALRQSRQSA